MKKTFLVLIAAIAAASSIQAAESQQPVPAIQYVVSQDRIEQMAAQLSAVTAREISKSAPKATAQKTASARDDRAIASNQSAAKTGKTVVTSG
jgi:DNA-binding PucR family transcriptional regulator